MIIKTKYNGLILTHRINKIIGGDYRINSVRYYPIKSLRKKHDMEGEDIYFDITYDVKDWESVISHLSWNGEIWAGWERVSPEWCVGGLLSETWQKTPPKEYK